MAKPDLRVEFCEFLCENPFLLAASPVARSGEMIERAFEMGWGGAVTKSVSLDQDLPDSSLSPRFAAINNGGCQLKASNRPIGLGNIDFRIDKSVEDTLNEYRIVKKKYPNKFLAVSIKAEYDREQWHKLARMAADTGADAIDLCLSCPDDDSDGGGCCEGSIGQNPQAIIQVIQWVKEVIDIPIIVKLNAHVTNISSIGRAVQEGGGDAISAINSVKSIAGYNADTLLPLPTIAQMSTSVGLSGAAIRPLATYCVYELKKNEFIDIPVSGIGGISCAQDAIEYMLAGATTVQIATQVMFEGYGLINDLKDGLKRFIEINDYKKVSDIIGSGITKFTASTKGLSRKQKLKSNIRQEECIRCGRCYIACRDGAYNAISFSKEDRSVKVDSDKCVGCGLCKVVCPVPGAVYFTQNGQKMEGLI